MRIQEMTRQASLDFLGHRQLGRLACAQANQPYVMPISFAYADDYIYSFSTLGRKIEWMRLNPLICFQADDIESPQKWSSVIAFGRYEELTKTPENEDARTLAYSLLQRRPDWWEPGYVRTTLDGKVRDLEPVYFRLHITEISGHQTAP